MHDVSFISFSFSLRSSAAALASGALISTFLTAAPARAEDDAEKRACVVAFEKAQVLRKSGALGAAKVQLELCTRPVCPQLVREECTQWTTELARVTPSLLLAARDPTGRDVAHARVTVDEIPLANALEGKAITLDPGRHAIRVEASGMLPVVESVVMREGERDRPLTVIMQPVPPKRSTTAEAPRADRPPPILAYSLAGAGAAALGAAIILDLSAASDLRKMRETCAPWCSESDVDAAKQKHYAALALGGAGIAAAGAGVFLLVTRAKAAPERTGFQLVPGARGASVSWRARF
jgi:hypothetical protein